MCIRDSIIGLCYFFASILENQEETTAYTKEYLLLIDDPVSSFDMENKGIQFIGEWMVLDIKRNGNRMYLFLKSYFGKYVNYFT